MASLSAPLKIPSYRILVGADIFSNLGNWLDLTALMVLITYQWGQGSGALAAFSICMGVPMILLGPLLSVFVDRLPLRNLMAICMLLRVAIGISLIFVPNLYVLLPLLFVRATLATLFMPARQAMIRSLVPQEHLRDAVSIGQTVYYSIQILGPSIGAGLMNVIGVRNVFAVEAGLLGLALLCLLFLPAKLNARPPKLQENSDLTPWQRYRSEFSEGIVHIRSRRLLRTSVVLMGIGMFLVCLYEGLFVLWVQALDFGQGSYGTLVSVLGFGSVLGVVLAGFIKNERQSPLVQMSMFALLAAMIDIVIGMGGMKWFELSWFSWAGILLLFGVSGAAVTVPFGYVLQLETPKHLVSRVTAATNSILNAATLLAPAIGGFLANSIGIGGVFVSSGILLGLLAVGTRLFHRPLIGDQQPLLQEEGEA